MTVFLPLHNNYNLYHEENEINNLVKDQDESNVIKYDIYISRLCIIIVFACSVFLQKN